MRKTDKEASHFVWADRDITSCDISDQPNREDIKDVDIEKNLKNESECDVK